MSNQENANPEDRKFLEDHIEEVIGAVCKDYPLLPGRQFADFERNQIVFGMTEDPFGYTMWNSDPGEVGYVTNAVLKVDTAPKQLVRVALVNFSQKGVIKDVHTLVTALVNTDTFTVTRISNFADLQTDRDGRDIYQREFIMEVISTDYKDLIQNKH